MKQKRIYIIGSGGSGKSYLADLLSDKFDIPHYHLDDINWIKKYTKSRIRDTKIKKLRSITRRKRWIIEGAYVSWISEAIKKADIVIWLYPNEFLMAYRIMKRFIKRKFSIYPPKESFVDIITGMWKVIGYRFLIKKGSGKTRYQRHKEIIDNHAVDFIIIRKRKELNALIDNGLSDIA